MIVSVRNKVASPLLREAPQMRRLAAAWRVALGRGGRFRFLLVSRQPESFQSGGLGDVESLRSGEFAFDESV
jgi:hypothetical protein